MNSSIILIKVTIAMIRDPKAIDPLCLNDLQTDLMKGLSGYPSSKYQIEAVELIQ